MVVRPAALGIRSLLALGGCQEAALCCPLTPAICPRGLVEFNPLWAARPLWAAWPLSESRPLWAARPLIETSSLWAARPLWALRPLMAARPLWVVWSFVL